MSMEIRKVFIFNMLINNNNELHLVTIWKNFGINFHQMNKDDIHLFILKI